MAEGGYIGLRRFAHRVMRTEAVVRHGVASSVHVMDHPISAGMFGDQADVVIGQAILKMIGLVCEVEGVGPDRLTITVTFE